MQATEHSRIWMAALAMVTAMAIIGVIDNYIALVKIWIGLWQFHLFRSLVALSLIGILALCRMGRLHVVRPGVVAARSICIGIAMLCYFGALGIMPIAQALAGLFTSPLIVLLITSLWLGQRIGPVRILAVVCGFAGILLVLQPDPSDLDPSLFLPVIGACFYAVSAILTRYMCAGESTMALLFAMFLALGAMGGIGLLLLETGILAEGDDFLSRGWIWPMWEAVPWVLLQAGGSLVAVFLIIRAYQSGEPSYVAVFEYSVMVFGPLYAWLAFGQVVGLWQAVGIALIVGAGTLVALRSGKDRDLSRLSA